MTIQRKKELNLKYIRCGIIIVLVFGFIYLYLLTQKHSTHSLILCENCTSESSAYQLPEQFHFNHLKQKIAKKLIKTFVGLHEFDAKAIKKITGGNTEETQRRVRNKNGKNVISFSTLARLGNNMFQYASMMGIAKYYGLEPVLDSSIHIHKNLKAAFGNLSAKEVEFEKIKWRQVNIALFPKHCPDGILDKITGENIMLIGYALSFMCFEQIKTQIKKDFVFRMEHRQAASLLFENAKHQLCYKEAVDQDLKNTLDVKENFKCDNGMNETVYVGVHVRRGDFLHADKIALAYYSAGYNYLNMAMKRMKEKLQGQNVKFIMASDDLRWCKIKFGDRSDVLVLPAGAREVHLAVLNMCDHMIISTGTFSWWAGYLSSGFVIYCSSYPNNKFHRRDFNRTTFFPHHWIGIKDFT